MTAPSYAVYAIKYAQREARRTEHFFGGDPHDGPMSMDYFVWAAVSAEQTVVIDTGFSATVAARRGRAHLRAPADALALLDIDAAQVPLVILTHLHYDHCGNLADFPAARFVVQDAALAFWTGRYAGRGVYRPLIEPEDIVALVRANFERRLRFVDGSAEVAPGISVHRVGGHARGLQVVRVATASGPLVLASDATHYYENIDEDRPFSLVDELAAMYEAFDTVHALAGPGGPIVPGHDPLVLERFPAVPGLEGIAVRLD
ncbi:MAG TPA: N-acyl homoserine lactonase family protein [Nitrolancea sp.]|nr:N-acyl homoserine lactonase family protein [Nitrolancea sp.]